MKETLKMMNSIIIGKEKETNERELIKSYKDKEYPNILAYFYSNNFTLIYKLSKSFKLLLNEDKASFCLQELDKCLKNYNINSKNKFITYFLRCYKNRLIDETKKLMNNNNKCNLLTSSLIENTIIKYDTDIEDYNILFNRYKLNDDESKICKLLLQGFSRSEIAYKYKLSCPRITQKILKIQQKIKNYT